MRLGSLQKLGVFHLGDLRDVIAGIESPVFPARKLFRLRLRSEAEANGGLVTLTFGHDPFVGDPFVGVGFHFIGRFWPHAPP